MLWYYSRDILSEIELLSGLQEKVHLAQEATDWEFVVIGLLDLNYYTRLATVGLPLGILPRGETICAHTITQPPGVSRRIPPNPPLHGIHSANVIRPERLSDAQHAGGLEVQRLAIC